jgi:hypothetical protein
LDWLLKYWPLIAAGGGGIGWSIKFGLRKLRDGRDKEVLASLPEPWVFPFLSSKSNPIIIENAGSIAKKLGRSEESVLASLQRLRNKGLAENKTGLWCKT